MQRLFAESDRKWPVGQIRSEQVAGAVFRAKPRGLLLHVFDQLRALNPFWKAGKVLDQRGQGKLAPGLMAFEDEWAEIGAGGVESSGVAGAA